MPVAAQGRVLVLAVKTLVGQRVGVVLRGQWHERAEVAARKRPSLGQVVVVLARGARLSVARDVVVVLAVLG